MVENKGFLTVITLAVLFLVGIYSGIIPMSSLPAGKEAAKELDTPTYCADPSNTMTIGPVRYKWSPTNTSAEASRLYVNEIDQGSKADGTTYTVAWKDKITLIYGLTSNAAYAQKAEIVAPCGPFASADTDGDANELIVADPSLVISCFNSDTGNKNDGAGIDNETISTGEAGRFDCSFTSADKMGISPGGKAHLLVEVNKTMYDVAQTVWGGKTFKDQQYPSHIALSNADSGVSHFEIEGCPKAGARSCDVKLGTLYVQTRVGENPTGAATSNETAVGAGDIKVTFVYENWYQNTVTGQPGFGWQKDDGAALGTNIPYTQTFYLSVV